MRESRATIMVPVSDSRVLVGCSMRCENILHRLVEVDLDHLAAERLLDLRQVLRRVVLELFEIDAVFGDLASVPAVGRARHAEPDGERGRWRGSRMTRTSWQKYLPPNWAPTPRLCVIL